MYCITNHTRLARLPESGHGSMDKTIHVHRLAPAPGNSLVFNFNADPGL